MKEKISACEGKCLGVFIKERRFSAGPEVFSPPRKKAPGNGVSHGKGSI